MTYLVSQLWFCLLLAWMLGNIVGWLLRGGCSTHIKRVEQNWRDRYLALEEEKEDYVAQVNKLRLVDDETDSLTEQLAKYQEIEQLNAKLRSHVKDVEIGAKVIQADLRAKTQALAKCQNILSASKKVIRTKDETLQKLARKLKIERHQLNRYQRQVEKYQAQDSKQVAEVKVEIDKLERDFAANATELSNVQTLLDEKEQTLKTKDEVLTTYEKQLAEKKQSVDQLTSTVKTKDEAIETYEKQLTEKSENLEELTATVKIRDEMVEYYEKQLDEQKTMNTTLTNKLDGLANEFAKVASELIKAKGQQEKESERYQAEKTAKVALTAEIQTMEGKLVDADKVLVQKEQALQTLQEQYDLAIQQQKSNSDATARSSTAKTSESSKLRKLERQLKHMKKKLKAAGDVTHLVTHAVTNTGDDADNDESLSSDVIDQPVVKTQTTHDKDKEDDSSLSSPRSLAGNLLGMNYEIEKIRGIGTGHGQRLRQLGITNSHELLRHVTSDQVAEKLAQEIACQTEDIVVWKKMADFLRIKGVNAEFAQLLVLSHLDSTKDVALSNAMQLLDKMKAARKKERRIRHMPELEEINEWIRDAKTFL